MSVQGCAFLRYVCFSPSLSLSHTHAHTHTHTHTLTLSLLATPPPPSPLPQPGIYFPSYAAAKKFLVNEEAGEKLKPYHLLLAGAIAGVPAAYLSTPFDVIKTRLQVVPQPGQTTYDGIFDAWTKISREEGFRALYKGAMMRVVRVYACVCVCVYVCVCVCISLSHSCILTLTPHSLTSPLPSPLPAGTFLPPVRRHSHGV